MVRVISVHHFTKQDVASIEHCNKQGMARGRGNIIFIGGEHKINIRNISEGAKLIDSFSTVDQVQQLVYCDTGNYLCTLETKEARHGGVHTHVRIYLNWDSDGASQPMRARIAGRVTPSMQSGTTNSLEMVEIPLRKPAVYVACCQSTGNLAVASGMTINIFRFDEKMHEISRQRFVDFDEHMELDVSFVVKELTISEDLVGCISDAEAHVYHLATTTSESKKESDNKLRLDAQPSRSSSKSPFRGKKVVLKEEMTGDVRESENYIDLGDMNWVPTLSYGHKPDKVDSRFLLFPSLVGAAQCGRTEVVGEILGPIEVSKTSNVRVRMVVDDGNGPKYTPGIYNVTTILHKRIDTTYDLDLPLSNLKIVSVYHNGNEKCNLVNKNVLHPVNRQNRVGVSIFVTSPHVGYLYHVTLERDTKDISVVKGGLFSYTAPVDSVSLEPSLLHALTLTGLETYTMRPHPHIITSHISEGLNMVVPPYWEESVCLVGLRPFLNVKSLILTDNCLTLVAANEENDEESHTLYTLHLPSVASLYREMVRVAKSHRSASPSIYLHLLLESHFVLTTALHHDPKALADDSEDLLALLQDSSALLGDYYASCESENEWNQAVQYYIAAGLTPDEIIERDASDSTGLVHVIMTLCLDKNTNILTESQVHCVLEALGNKAPGIVSDIILNANCMKQYKPDKVIDIVKSELQKNTEPRPNDVLCLALMLLDKQQPEQAVIALAMLRPYELVNTLFRHPNLLIKKDNQIQLSALSQVLVEYKMDDFTETFVSLIGEGILSLDAFVDAFIAIYPIVSCSLECNINSLRLRNFLESFFMEFAQSKEMMSQKKNYKRSVTVLIGLYLASLMGAFKNEENEDKAAKEQRASYVDLFAERPKYLNHLPPFNSATPQLVCSLNSPADKNTKDIDTAQCACSVCCLHLLVLQSLMTSDVPSKDDKESVLRFVNSNPHAIGADSLKLLSLSKNEKFTFILDNYPKAIVQFALDSFQSPEDWTTGLTQLLERRSQTDENDPNYEVYSNMLDGTFEILVNSTSFDNFCYIVPKKWHLDISNHIENAHSAALVLHLKKVFMQYADNVLSILYK